MAKVNAVAVTPLELASNAAQNAKFPSEDKALTRETKTNHHGDLTQAFVKAAREILRKEGSEKLSLRAFAAKAGVSQSAPYSHFANKRDLLRAVGASGFRELALAMEATQDSELHPRRQILEYGTAYVDIALDNPAIYRLMISTLDPFPQTGPCTGVRDDRNTLAMEATKPYILLNAAFRQIVRNPERADMLSVGAWSMAWPPRLAKAWQNNLQADTARFLQALMDVQSRPDRDL